MKKGMMNIEFMVSVLVFLLTIGFILINIAGNLIPLHRDAELDAIRSRAYQLSQIIVFDEGDPKNWEVLGNATRVGLSTGDKYVMSSAKISSFNATCNSNYDNLLEMYFGNTKLLFSINITDSSGKNLLDCGKLTSPQVSLKRFAVLDTTKDMLKIEISVKL